MKSYRRKNAKKATVLILCIALIVGAFSPAALPVFAGDEANVVEFFVDGQKISEVEKSIDPNDATKLSSSDIPDDPELEGYNFIGWQDRQEMLKAENKREVWKSKDLKDYVIQGDTVFDAILETAPDKEKNEDDKQQSEEDRIQESTGSNQKSVPKQKSGIKVQAAGNLETVMDGQTLEDGQTGSINNWSINTTKTLVAKVNGVNGSTNIKDNYITFDIPEGLNLGYYPGKGGSWSSSLDNLVTLESEPSATVVDGVNVTYGKLVYKLKEGTTLVEIEVSVSPDKNRFYANHKVPIPIKVSLNNSNNGMGNSETCKLEASLKATVSQGYNVSPIKQIYAKPGKNVEGYYTYASPVKDGEAVPTLYKSLEITYEYPAQATLAGLRFNQNLLPNDKLDKIWTAENGQTFKGVEVDENNHTIKLYYKDSRTAKGIYPTLKFDSTVVPGNVYKMPNFQVKGVAYDGTVLDGSSPQNPMIASKSNPDRGIMIAQDSDTLNMSHYALPPGVQPNQNGLNIVTKFFLDNASGETLTDQKIKYEFPKQFNVRAFDVPVKTSTSKTVTVNYETYGGASGTKTVTVNGVTNRDTIRPSSLGLAAGDILKSATIDCGEYDSDYSTSTNVTDGCNIYGNVLPADANGSYTVRYGITDQNTITEGDMKSYNLTPANATTKVPARGFIGNIGNETKQASIKAGESTNVWASTGVYSTAFSSGVNTQRVENPIFYLIEPEGMSVKNSSVIVRYENTSTNISNTVSEQKTAADGTKYREIRTSNCVMGGYDSNANWIGNIRIGFEYETNKSMKTDTFNLQDMIHIGPQPTTLTQKQHIRFSDGEANWGTVTKKDAKDLNENNITSENLAVVDGQGKLTVAEDQVVFIGAKIKLKSEPDSSYRTYRQGDESTKVYFTPGSTSNYKVDIENRSEFDTEELTVYVPVPKKDQNLGADFMSGPSKWDMKLKNAISLTNSKGADQTGNFEISYGLNVTALDYRTATTKYKTVPGASDWEDINMIKIHAKNPIEKNTATSALLEYDIDVTETEAGALTGEENIFNPSYAVKYAKGEGQYPGEKVAAVLQVAEVSGKVFLDGIADGQLKNGIKDSNESYYKDTTKPVKVKIVSGPATFIGDEVNVDANGEYKFDGLTKGFYDIQFILPATSNYVFTKSHPKGSASEASNANRNTGQVKNIDASKPTEARNINAGLTVNEAPVLDVGADVEITTSGSFTPKVLSITDDLDGTIPTTAASIESNVPSPLVPGTYKVTYSAIDSDGAKGTSIQKVKVHGNPYVVSKADITKPVASAPSMSDLTNNVLIRYAKASDTFGAAVVDTKINAEITSPSSAPNKIGRYQISFRNTAVSTYISAGKITGSYTLTLEGAPIVSAMKADNSVYTSNSKTNQNVTLKATTASGLTLQYSIDNGSNWTNAGDGSLQVAPANAVRTTYQFRYLETPTYVTNFIVDINKVAPKLTNTTTSTEVTDGGIYSNPFNVKADANVGAVNVVATKGAASITYTDNMKVAKDVYTFKLNDAYGNSKTYSFSFNAPGINATGTSITYDGQTHKINADAEKSGSALMYSTTSGITGFTSTNPGFTEAGTHTVWVKATHDDYPDTSAISKQVVINKRSIQVRPADKAREYNGSPLTADNVQLTGSATLVGSQTLDKDSAAFTGSQTNVGSSNSNVTGVGVKAGNVDKTNNYAISYIPGSLKVTLNTTGLKIASTDVNTVYDGKKHSYSVNKSLADAKLYYSSNQTGSFTNNIPAEIDANKYTVWVKAERANYASTAAIKANLNISKRSVTIKPANDSKVFDGKVLNASNIEIAGGSLASGETVDKSSIKYTGTQTDAGTNKNIKAAGAKVKSGSKDTTKNYNIGYSAGTLKVDKREITLKPKDVSKTYDGKVLKASNCEVVSGKIVSGHKITSADYSGSQTDPGKTTSSMKNAKVSDKNTDNYDFSYKTGTITITGNKDNGGGTTPVTPPVTPTPGGSGNNGNDTTNTTSNVVPATGTESQTNNYVDNSTPSTSAQNEAARVAENEGIPTFGIGDNKVPLFGNNAFDSWSFVNLILTIAGVMIAIFMGVMAAIKRGQENNLVDEVKLFNPLWVMIGVGLGILGVIVFVATQDIYSAMVILDGWTFIGIAIVGGQVTSTIMAFKNRFEMYPTN